MENYRKSAHCTYDIKYHIVWITKYRKPAITGQIALRTSELIRGICQANEVEILAGHVESDHIHLLVSVPPHLSVSKLVQYIKGNTSRKLQMEYEELNKQFWGQYQNENIFIKYEPNNKKPQSTLSIKCIYFIINSSNEVSFV
ncbi:IS200/IS605 family transposase [Anaerosporobacter sp.]|uniref:IS200/IS605 family transposase n=1 Tax=Anaerosporobacter sp. TaxID=1872529 RepID=UPI00286F5854|nr:IS200/IS605 family transposase [Anaerosporobacter sp.]